MMLTPTKTQLRKLPEVKVVRVQDFSGGLNNKFAPHLIADNELADVQNMHYDEKGSLRKRKGYVRHYSSAFATGGIRGLYNYRKADGTSQLIMAADDKLFYDKPHFVKKWDSQTDWEAPGTIKSNVTTSDTPGDIKIANPAVPTFTRNSIAYKQDGTQVAAGSPRYETGKYGQAIMVEEGTTNLLSVDQSSAETDTTGFTAVNEATLTKDATYAWHGAYALKVVTRGAVAGEGFETIYVSASEGVAYSGQIRLRGAGMVRVYIIARSSADADLGSVFQDVTLSNTGWTTCKLENFVTPTNTARLTLRVVTWGTAQAVTFYADGLQLEQKPYATFWQHPSSRAPETLTIPAAAGVLLAAEGTVEGWIKLLRSPGTQAQYIFDGGGGANANLVLYVTTAGKLECIYGTGTATVTITGTTTLAKDTFYHVAVKWASSGVTIYLNGASEGTNATAPVITFGTNAYLGSKANGTSQLDGLIDDLRISSRARTDAEILADYQSTTPLAWDLDTTYKIEFDGNLNLPTSRQGYWRSETVDISAVSDKTSGVVTDVDVIPAGTSYVIKSRTSADQVTWSDWLALGPGGVIQSPPNNYLQLRVEYQTTVFPTVPSHQSIQVTFDQTPSVVQMASGLLTTTKYEFATLNDTLWIVDGETVPKKWDGVTFGAMGGNPPSGAHILAHKNRLFIASTPANPSRIYFSELEQPENWPTLNFIDVGKGDGDRITSLSRFMDNIVVFKEFSIWLLQGDSPSNFVLRRVVDQYGCIAPFSVATVKGGLIYLSQDGVRLFDGVASTLLSEKVEKIFTEKMNRKWAKEAAGIVFENKYYLSIPEGIAITPNVVLVYDLLRGAWTVYRGINASRWVLWRRYNADYLFFGDSNVGQVHEFGTGFNDDGAAIDAYFVTKAFDIGTPEVEKLARRVFITAKDEPQTLQLSFVKDGVETASTNVSVSGNVDVSEVIPSSLGVDSFRTLSLKVRNNELNKSTNVLALALEYVPKSLRPTP